MPTVRRASREHAWALALALGFGAAAPRAFAHPPPVWVQAPGPSPESDADAVDRELLQLEAAADSLRRIPEAPPATGAGSAPNEPLPLPENPRALWVVRDALLSPKSIRRMVADAAKGGITDLFVQVCGRGDAYYTSDLVGAPGPLRDAYRRHGPYDPLGMVLKEARPRGIRVHAWLNVYLVWSGEKEPPPGHVVREHPEWVAVGPEGLSMLGMSRRRIEAAQTEGIYLEPGNGEVLRHFVGVVRELLDRYPVDGIHLDYVRYPGMEVGYGEAMREGFREAWGVDPVSLTRGENRLLREHGADRAILLHRGWREFKAAQVTALVRAVRAEMRSRPSPVMLSAAVRPDPAEALQVFGQDWVGWLEQGLVDVVAPMMYSPSRSHVERQAKAVAAVAPPERVWAGIAVYNQSLSAAAAKILTCLQLGLGGISIYSYNSLPGGGGSLLHLNGSR
jgi:uncharacterized lipoprotein YddW (UPF0748 family)